jgi:hypothetical protein
VWQETTRKLSFGDGPNVSKTGVRTLLNCGL